MFEKPRTVCNREPMFNIKGRGFCFVNFIRDKNFPAFCKDLCIVVLYMYVCMCVHVSIVILSFIFVYVVCILVRKNGICRALELKPLINQSSINRSPSTIVL